MGWVAGLLCHLLRLFSASAKHAAKSRDCQATPRPESAGLRGTPISRAAPQITRSRRGTTAQPLVPVSRRAAPCTFGLAPKNRGAISETQSYTYFACPRTKRSRRGSFAKQPDQSASRYALGTRFADPAPRGARLARKLSHAPGAQTAWCGKITDPWGSRRTLDRRPQGSSD